MTWSHDKDEACWVLRRSGRYSGLVLRDENTPQWKGIYLGRITRLHHTAWGAASALLKALGE